MTYASNLAESEQVAIPELFYFSCGSTIERYTNWATDLTFLGSTWTRAHIKRSRFKQDTQLGRTSVSVAAPVSGIFANYVLTMPLEPVEVIIYRALQSDMTDFITMFHGFVKGISIDKGIATAEAETRSDLLSQPVPRYIYQSYCNYEVFHDGCTLIEADYRVAGTVYYVDSAEIRCTAFGPYYSQHANYFQGGKVQFGSDWRFITSHTTNTITLNVAFRVAPAVGDTVYAYPGCDGSAATCDTKFGNLDDFCGMAYIPSRNPAMWGFV
jgi:uncharacterized phage protein (TIGR02218 family)